MRIRILNFATMQHPNILVAERWLAAFNAHDIDALLDLYDDAAEHYSAQLRARRPETKGLVHGKKALRDWWQGSLDRLPSLRYEVTSLVADDARVSMEYMRHADGEEDRRVAEVLDVRNGRIIASRAYNG